MKENFKNPFYFLQKYYIIEMIAKYHAALPNGKENNYG